MSLADQFFPAKTAHGEQVHIDPKAAVETFHVEQLPEAQAPGPGNEALPPKIKIRDHMTVDSGDFKVELNVFNTRPLEKSHVFITQISTGKTIGTDLSGLIALDQAIEELRRVSNTKTL